ncbi:glycosyltransferase [Megamonas hypermegale]|uniref:glycosyltransferase n=1 Tax=Megamonas hypermegale TaxID=158847 RepID=UPI001957E1CB|nr:glycosyltransferase [Megamonas hypermegale]MBM6761291.1 glycosyltransferase [Megamonas hypermegale]
MKKIFNIVSGNPSGALNISMEISEYLKQCGFDVIDIFRKYNKTKYKNAIVIKDKCTIDYIISLSSFIKDNNPDLIIVHGYSTHIWTKLAVAYSGKNVKLIHVEHNTEKYTFFRRYLTQKLDKYTNKYICVSKGVANHLIKQGIDKSKVKVIYNGIDIKKFNLIKEKHDIFTVGMVARFSKQKDQMTLIKAIEYLVKEKNEKIKLLLMGEGKTKKRCKEYVKEHNIEDYIKFIDGNFKDLILKTDIFVLSTHYEGLPLVICEAMASKTPVIGTDVIGVNEIIIDNETGLLVRENDVIDLADKIMELKKKKLKKEEIENKSYGWVLKNFNKKQMIINYKSMIKKLL